MGERQGWPWFLAWTAAGGLLVVSYLTVFSIGLFVLPFAVVAVWLVGRHGRAWPELLGGVSGAGLVLVGVALANRGSTPCPEGGALTIPPGQTSVECGGLDPVPWLVAGLAFVAVGAVAYSFALARQGAGEGAASP